LNCSIPILIKLININDNPIVFDLNSLVYNITENNPIPFYIGRIHLLDTDQLFSSNYEFYLRNISSQISIDQTSGSIILYEKLDREFHGPELTYDILAMDQNNKQNNLTNKLILYIIDINDHGPGFDKKSDYINISKTIRPNTIVYRLNATSKDPVVNGNMKYYLLNSSDYFSIDEKTGIIRLKRSIPSTLMNITLNIEVLEDGINLTDRTDLVFSIINDDKNYFNFENTNECFIEENQPIGTRICTIGKNSEDFIYELIDKTHFFQILENNGTIFSRKIFDYETDKHQFNVTIIVKDRENQVRR
jgi:hypothetical protein